MEQSAVGTIFNVQRFSLHDGPGMRDLIFLKGCPLRCQWCANPESQQFQPELDCRASKCIGCQACAAACPTGAAALGPDGRIQVDRTRCQSCFACARVCCTGALSRVGEQITARALVERVMEQHMSWRAEGGITLSGGEPLAQADFAAELLERFRAEGVSTALETCGCVPYEAFRKAAPFCDLIFFDLKCMDPAIHKQYTGVENGPILDNLLALSREFPKLPLRVRTPLIPGINDSRVQLLDTVAFLRQLSSLADYELLPYHNWGEGKYHQLGREYPLAGVKPPDKQAVRRLNDELRAMLGLRPEQEG